MSIVGKSEPEMTNGTMNAELNSFKKIFHFPLLSAVSHHGFSLGSLLKVRVALEFG